MQKFKRTKENFTCAHCGAKVKGNGYTNHCPKCLWSRHVDVNPGDRSNGCDGMMEPVGLELEKSAYRIKHRCQTCGLVTRCKSAPEDDIKALMALSETLAKKALF